MKYQLLLPESFSNKLDYDTYEVESILEMLPS